MQQITKVSSVIDIQDACGKATYDRRTCNTKHVRWIEALVWKNIHCNSQKKFLLTQATAPKFLQMHLLIIKSAGKLSFWTALANIALLTSKAVMKMKRQ
jgi:hypothetical protein